LVMEPMVLATFLKSLVSSMSWKVVAGVASQPSLVDLTLSTQPFTSCSSTPTMFLLARPEYLYEWLPMRLFGSAVKSGSPPLPRFCRMKQFCLRVSIQMRSAEAIVECGCG